MQPLQLTNPLPIDTNARTCAIGTTLKTFWIDAIGSFQPLELPSGIECKTIKINVHDGSLTFAHTPIEFHISSEETGEGWDWWKSGAIFSIGQLEGIICYIRAEAGNKIAITILD